MLCQQNSQPAPQLQPLNEDEKRQILSQLYELQSCRQAVSFFEDFVKREREQDLREQKNAERALELEQQATKLAERDRDIWKEKAEFYEQAFRTLTRPSKFSCVMRMIVSVGIWRCK